MARAQAFGGPEDRTGPGPQAVAPGVWLTSGRAAVVESEAGLLLIDPGDEPPDAVLRDLDARRRATGAPLRWVAVTHAHQDHVANLEAVRRHAPGARLVAHRNGPLAPDIPVSGPGPLPGASQVEAIPTPGHSPWGDDLSFWLPGSGVLFCGDLVQPKGETWEQAFYPSPYPFFTDGDRYLSSLDRLAALPVAVLVTGHREVRHGTRWVELTARAIRAVDRAVQRWEGPDELRPAAAAIFRDLCRQRGIPDPVVAERMAPRDGLASPFERFDLPGIAYYWRKHRT